MLQHRSYIQIDLERGEAASLLHAEGTTLRCVRGKLWVTEDNGGGDVVLEAGDSYYFESTKPHRFRNPFDAPARLISAATPANF